MNPFESSVNKLTTPAAKERADNKLKLGIENQSAKEAMFDGFVDGILEASKKINTLTDQQLQSPDFLNMMSMNSTKILAGCQALDVDATTIAKIKEGFAKDSTGEFQKIWRTEMVALCQGPLMASSLSPKEKRTVFENVLKAAAYTNRPPVSKTVVDASAAPEVHGHTAEITRAMNASHTIKTGTELANGATTIRMLVGAGFVDIQVALVADMKFSNVAIVNGVTYARTAEGEGCNGNLIMSGAETTNPLDCDCGTKKIEAESVELMNGILLGNFKESFGKLEDEMRTWRSGPTISKNLNDAFNNTKGALDHYISTIKNLILSKSKYEDTAGLSNYKDKVVYGADRVTIDHKQTNLNIINQLKTDGKITPVQVEMYNLDITKLKDKFPQYRQYTIESTVPGLVVKENTDKTIAITKGSQSVTIKIEDSYSDFSVPGTNLKINQTISGAEKKLIITTTTPEVKTTTKLPSRANTLDAAIKAKIEADDNLKSKKTIGDLQVFLGLSGYNPGPIDGKRGKQTLGALRQYLDGASPVAPTQSAEVKALQAKIPEIKVLLGQSAEEKELPPQSQEEKGLQDSLGEVSGIVIDKKNVASGSATIEFHTPNGPRLQFTVKQEVLSNINLVKTEINKTIVSNLDKYFPVFYNKLNITDDGRTVTITMKDGTKYSKEFDRFPKSKSDIIDIYQCSGFLREPTEEKILPPQSSEEKELQDSLGKASGTVIDKKNVVSGSATIGFHTPYGPKLQFTVPEESLSNIKLIKTEMNKAIVCNLDKYFPVFYDNLNITENGDNVTVINKNGSSVGKGFDEFPKNEHGIIDIYRCPNFIQEPWKPLEKVGEKID